MMSVLKGTVAAAGLVIAGMLVVMAALVILVSSFFAPVLVLVALIAVALLAALGGPAVMLQSWRRSSQAAVSGTIGDVPVHGGMPVNAVRTKPGPLEWGLIAGAIVLVLAEVAAFRGGLGPVAAVVGLGYFLVIGLTYWVYRQARSAATVRRQELEVTPSSRIGVEQREMLRRVDIFRGLSAEDGDRVASIARRVQVPAGEVLGRAGEQGEQIFVILEGKAQLSARSDLGEITVRIAEPGESLPLAALIEPGTLITSIVAMTDMDLLVIPRAELMGLCSRHPDIGAQIYAAIADVLGGRYRQTLSHLTASAERALKEADFFANV